MHDWEKIDKPHAVYQLWSFSGELLYVGCAFCPFGRVGHHLTVQPWYRDVAKAVFEWHPSAPAAYKAEAHTIQLERPRYNKLVLDPNRLGADALRKANMPKRGNGLNCPKCGTPKTRRKDPYCLECFRRYRAEYRRKILLANPSSS